MVLHGGSADLVVVAARTAGGADDARGQAFGDADYHLTRFAASA
jgi:hypothetical protein